MSATRKSASGSGRSREPAAIAMLIADHRKLKKLFSQFAASDEDGDRDFLCRQICGLLTVSNLIREELFYPAARDALDDARMIDAAEIDNGVAADLVTQLQDEDLDMEKRDANVMLLREYVLHHFREEESRLFKLIRKADIDLEELAEEMLARREELDAEYDLSDDDDDEDEDENEAYVDRPSRARRAPAYAR